MFPFSLLVHEKQRIFKSIEMALEVFENKHRKNYSQLNEVMLKGHWELPSPVVGKRYKDQICDELPNFIHTLVLRFFTRRYKGALLELSRNKPYVSSLTSTGTGKVVFSEKIAWIVKNFAFWGKKHFRFALN